MQNVIEDIYDLTPTQKGMLFHSLYSPGGGVYVTQLHCMLEGHMDLEAFRRAWQKVVDRHPILRTSFSWEDVDRPVQIVERQVPLPFRTDDWTELSREEQSSRLAEFIEEDRSRGFGLSEAPLMRIALFKIADDQYEFVWTHHHLLLDGWSMPLILKEAFSLYDALIAGQTIRLEPRRPYRDFVAWLRRQDLVSAEGYWRSTLAGFVAPTPLAADGAAGGIAGHGSGPGEHIVWMDTVKSSALQTLARQQRLTLNTLLQGAWALLLSRYSGEEDVVFGATVSGRPPELVGVESMVGLFINTLPVRVQVPGDVSVIDWLKGLQVRQVEQRQFEYSPLVEVQKWSDVRPGLPLFESLLVFESYPTDDSMWKWSDHLAIRSIHPTEQPSYPLTLLVIPGPEIGVKAIYDTERFSHETIARMLNHLRNLLESIVSDLGCLVSRVPMLSQDEREQLLVGWNQTARPYSTDQCMHELFEAQVQRTPDATAVIAEDEHLTYQQLNSRANQLARFLQARGGGPGTLVAVCMERGPQMIIALLGILKAGAAYVPLDPAYPQDRLRFTLEDAGVPILLTQGHLAEALTPQETAVVRLCDDWAAILGESEENLARAATPDSLAYVIYTSGSTGRPKGVAIEHRNAVNFIHWGTETFDPNDLAGVLGATSICFDLSVFEIFVTLSAGGKVILAENALQLPTLSARAEVTLVNTVPSAMAELVRQNALPESVRIVNLAGEPLPRSLVDKIYQRPSVRRVYNLYGPSETTTYSTFTCVPRDDRKSPSIGRPIANTQVYLLDRHMQPVPVGVTGEMYIGGSGVARGYLNRPELNNDRFVLNPFAAVSAERLYRTGDLARYQPDGNIDFLGRIDNQVKIRGFRIELGEIEAVLGAHLAIADLVLVAREDAPGDKRLVAYLVSSRMERPSTGELRAFLKEKLPEYMVPSAFVFLDALPLTPNGKVDRKALPVPDMAHSVTHAASGAPRTDEEQTLVRIWSRVLGQKQVGVHDNFFELGGDSILSIQIISQANQAGLRLTPRQLFEHPTVAELAAVVGCAENTAAEQGTVMGEVPLTPIQQWFFEQGMEAEHHWNHALLFEVLKPVERQLLEQMVRKLLSHHDALRLRFRRQAGHVEGYHAAEDEPAAFCWVDLANFSPAEQRMALEAKAEELQTSLNLSEGPLVQIAFFDMGADMPGRLLLIIHHLAVDGVSWRILMEDIETLLEGISAGAAELPPKTASYQEWARRLVEWAHSDAMRDQLPFWLDVAHQQPPRLPVDKVAGANRWESARTATVGLTVEETRDLLQEVPAIYGTQVNDVLLAALLHVFARWTGSNSLLFDLEGHGREPLWDDVDLTRSVGWFTSIHPVVLHAGTAVTPGELLKTVKEQMRRIPNRGIGYGLLRYLSADSGIRQQLSELPQAEICFNYLGKFDLTPGEPSWLRPANESTGSACSFANRRRYLLDINGMVENGALRMVWTYSEDTHTLKTVTRLAEDYIDALREIIATCAGEEGEQGQSQCPPPMGLTSAELCTVRQTVDHVCGKGQIIEDIYPCAPLQQEIISHTGVHTESGVWLCQITWVFEGSLDVISFERAWRLVIEQHPVLRTAFVAESLSQPVQVVLKSVDFSLVQEDWRGFTDQQQEDRLADYLREDRQRGFNLAGAPLLRVALMRLGDESHQFVWTYHHLVLDGWSLAMVLNQVLACYEALRRRESFAFALSDRSYRQFIAWQNGQDLAASERYWRRTLRAFPAVAGSDNSNALGERGFGEAESVLSEQETTALQAFARQHGLTLNTMVQGAWALTLGRSGTSASVVFGTTVSGRSVEFPGAESVVGLLTNTLPAVVPMPGNKPIIPWLRELQGEQVELRQYEHINLAQLREWGGLPTDFPFFRSVVVFENYPRDASLRTTGRLLIDSNRLAINRVRATEHTHYPLRLMVLPTPGLTLRLVYDRSLFEEQTSGRMLKEFSALLRGFVQFPS